MKWYVVTPEYDRYTYGPPDPGCDVVLVEADSKQKAIVAGVRAMRADKTFCRYHREYLDASENPFRDMKAYPAEEERCSAATV